MSQRNGKKVVTSEVSSCDVIEKYYYIRKKNLTENNNSKNNCKCSEISKSVTENMSVSLN